MKAEATITSASTPDVEALRQWLRKMVAAMRFVELVSAVVSLVVRMRDLNTELTKQLAQMRRKKPRSERLEWVERQLSLPWGGVDQDPAAEDPGRPDDLAGDPDDLDEEPEEPTRQKKPRSPKAGGRAELPRHLERVHTSNPVPPRLATCPTCMLRLRAMASSPHERLDIIPAKIFVAVRHDERAVCDGCNRIVTAPAPPAIVPQGKLSDTLILQALTDKYLEHVPIERQCQRFERAGVDLAPQTLARSVGAAIDLFEPIAKEVRKQGLEPGLLGTDATGIPILDPATSEGIRTGTMWAWTNARWVTFDYAPKAGSEPVKEFLGKKLDRDVQCDGTNTLSFIEREGGRRPGCWGHGRRRFVEAARSRDKVALQVLKRIAPLFRIEQESSAAGDHAEARKQRGSATADP